MRGNQKKETHLFLTGAAVLPHCSLFISFLPTYSGRLLLHHMLSCLLLSVSPSSLFYLLISVFLGLLDFFLLFSIIFSCVFSSELPSRSLAEKSHTFGFVYSSKGPCRSLPNNLLSEIKSFLFHPLSVI